MNESTADYLPAIPVGAHIDGQDTVIPGQVYTYSLSAPITNAQNYIWAYTGTGATTITPKNGGTEVDITFAPGATPGNVVCKFDNNYTKPVNDTVELTFAINDITTGIEENASPEKVVVAPNPTSDMVSVLNMKNKNIKSVEVYTTDWKQVRKQAISRGEDVKVDVADLPA